MRSNFHFIDNPRERGVRLWGGDPQPNDLVEIKKRDGSTTTVRLIKRVWRDARSETSVWRFAEAAVP